MSGDFYTQDINYLLMLCLTENNNDLKNIQFKNLLLRIINLYEGGF